MDYFPLDMIRSIRNDLLQKSDLYVLPDFPHATPEIRQEWIQYRQALRDITKTVELSEDGLSVKILSVVWPAKPL
jgi:hypothetical protein